MNNVREKNKRLILDAKTLLLEFLTWCDFRVKLIVGERAKELSCPIHA
jgi:hypothetical protein